MCFIVKNYQESLSSFAWYTLPWQLYSVIQHIDTNLKENITNASRDPEQMNVMWNEIRKSKMAKIYF